MEELQENLSWDGVFKKFSKIYLKNLIYVFPLISKLKIFLAKLGAKKVLNMGNLKFSQSEKENIDEEKNFGKFVKSKKIWCASSTHFNEEEVCGLVHKVKKKI